MIERAFYEGGDHAYLEAAQRLAWELRQSPGAFVDGACLRHQLVETLVRSGLFGPSVPARYGGSGASIAALARSIAELAQVDGSVAWTFAMLAGGAWLAATLYSDSVLDEVFRPGGNFRTSFVLAPQDVVARQVEGGIMIDAGMWHYASGIHHAGWVIVGVPIPDEEGRPLISAALLPAEQVNKLDDWDVVGLRGTGSDSISAKNVFVPEERVARLKEYAGGRFDAAQRAKGARYQIPIIPFFATLTGHVPLGLAKGMLGLFVQNCRTRRIGFLAYERQGDAPVTHLQLGEASAKVEAAELLLERSAAELEACTIGDNPPPSAMRLRVWRDASYAGRLAWEAADLLAGASGAAFARSGNPMSRHWIDLRIATLHAGAVASSAIEEYGRMLLRMPPISTVA